MTRGRQQHTPRNAELREALLAASPPPPFGEVDWDRLHARIMANARPLSARSSGRPWWTVTAEWASRGIPITATATAAAAAVLILALGRPPAALPPVEDGGPAADGRVTVEDALAVEAGPLFGAGSEDEAWASAILYYDGEEW